MSASCPEQSSLDWSYPVKVHSNGYSLRGNKVTSTKRCLRYRKGVLPICLSCKLIGRKGLKIPLEGRERVYTFMKKKTDKKSCLSGVNTIHLVCSYHFRLYYESFHCPHCLLHRNIVGEILLKKNKSFITRWTRHYFHLGIR